MCRYLIGAGVFEGETLGLAGVPQGREGVVGVLCCEEASHPAHQPLPRRLQVGGEHNHLFIYVAFIRTELQSASQEIEKTLHNPPHPSPSLPSPNPSANLRVCTSWHY